MSVLYVAEQGTRLLREGHTVAVFRGADRLHLQPLATLEAVVLLGRVEISNAVVSSLGRLGIPCAFLSRDGRLKALLQGAPGRNVLLREKQYALGGQTPFRLDMSRRIVMAKVQNAVRVLQKRGVSLDDVFEEKLRNLRRSLRAAANLEQLRGLEGSFAAHYFGRFAAALKEPMGFRRREKHPPRDPVNILLSFGYTLLFQRVFALLLAHGLDPYRGFYHDLSYGHPALASDLMEEFRAPVVDTLVLTLVNRRQIREEHFERKDDRLLLSRDAVRLFVTAFEARLNTVVRYRRGRRLPFARVLDGQVLELAKAVAHGRGYRPFAYM